MGSISSAVWIGRRFYGIDIREHGSGNAGATNALRVLGWRAALPIFIIDFIKGFFAVYIAIFSNLEADTNELFNLKIILAAAAVIGHIFPVFTKFKGGKGVATLTGAVLAVYPPGVLLCLATFIIIFLLTRYVSLSSMLAGLMLPISYFIFEKQSSSLLIFCCVIAVLLIATHRANIKRLISGTESKIKFGKKDEL